MEISRVQPQRGVAREPGPNGIRPIAALYHHSLYGKREQKYATLNQATLDNLPWQQLQPKVPEWFFVPKDFGVEEEYKQGFSVYEFFPLTSTGIKTHRDDFVIDIEKNTLKNRIQKFFDPTVTDDSILTEMGLKDNSDFDMTAVRKNRAFSEEKLLKIAYRPFDTRSIYYDTVLIDRNRENVMRHMMQDNIALITMRQVAVETGYNHVLLTPALADNRTFYSNKGTMNFFPLYLYPEKTTMEQDQPERIPNLNMAIVQKIADGIGVNSFTPLDLLDYIYAVLHTPAYREKYKEFLKIDFPRVPYPTDADEFRRLVGLGGELRRVHLLETKPETPCIFPATGTNIVNKPHYKDNRVYINTEQYFQNVPQSAWEFYIGGYQPAQKWLKDRSGRILNYEDIAHYQKIIYALQETERIMSCL